MLPLRAARRARRRPYFRRILWRFWGASTLPSCDGRRTSRRSRRQLSRAFPAPLRVPKATPYRLRSATQAVGDRRREDGVGVGWPTIRRRPGALTMHARTRSPSICPAQVRHAFSCRSACLPTALVGLTGTALPTRHRPHASGKSERIVESLAVSPALGALLRMSVAPVPKADAPDRNGSGGPVRAKLSVNAALVVALEPEIPRQLSRPRPVGVARSRFSRSRLATQ